MDSFPFVETFIVPRGEGCGEVFPAKKPRRFGHRRNTAPFVEGRHQRASYSFFLQSGMNESSINGE